MLFNLKVVELLMGFFIFIFFTSIFMNTILGIDFFKTSDCVNDKSEEDGREKDK